MDAVTGLTVVGKEEQIELLDRIEYFGDFTQDIGRWEEAVQM